MAQIGERRGAYKVLVGKPGGKSSLGRPRFMWDNNINIGLQEVGLGTLDWIDLAQNRDRRWDLVSSAINLRVP